MYELTYGVDNQRRKSVFKVGGITKSTRYYLGDYEEEIDPTGNIRKIHYLSGGAILVKNHGNDTLMYAYSDNQGSLTALTNESGTVVERYAYDPWGRRLNPTDWTATDSRSSWLINHGYTGHEHLDAFGIINMNGRVYDPATAQFFSPDPFVQEPGNWQNYNRYGYCLNNPTNNTDPSGYKLWSDSYYTTRFMENLDRVFGGGGSRLNEIGSNWYNVYQNDLRKGYTGGMNDYFKSTISGDIDVHDAFVNANIQGWKGSYAEFNTAYGNRRGSYIYQTTTRVFHEQREDAPKGVFWLVCEINLRTFYVNVPSGQEGGILDKGLDYAGRTNDGVDAFAKTLGTNGLTAVMVNGGKTIGRYSGPAGVVISAGQVFNGVRKDGYQFGYNAQKATAGAVGGTVGAWTGFQAGAWAGFESGFAIGLCFEGVGAIPGAVIGGIVGGFGGAFGGAYGGSKLGESLISNKAQ